MGRQWLCFREVFPPDVLMAPTINAERRASRWDSQTSIPFPNIVHFRKFQVVNVFTRRTYFLPLTLFFKIILSDELDLGSPALDIKEKHTHQVFVLEEAILEIVVPGTVAPMVIVRKLKIVVLGVVVPGIVVARVVVTRVVVPKGSCQMVSCPSGYLS